MPLKKLNLLLIDNYDSFVYNLYQYLAEEGAKVTVVRNDKISISDINKLDIQGIVLSPGPGRPEDAGICVKLVKTFSGRIPILGVCLGHQAIAVAFGARVVQSSKIMHGKTSKIYHDKKVIFKNIDSPFVAARYHSLVVARDTLPQFLHVTARTYDNYVMGIRHRWHPTEGVQFHPESFLTTCGKQIIRNFLDICYEKCINNRGRQGW